MELVKKYGVYPEYEEIQKQAAAPQAIEEPAGVEKDKTAAPTAEQKPKRGLFRRKGPGEKTEPEKAKPESKPVPQPPTKPKNIQEPADEGTKKKAFKLRFGKKK